MSERGKEMAAPHPQVLGWVSVALSSLFLCGLSSWDGSPVPPTGPQHPSDLAGNLQMFLEAGGQSLSDRGQEQCSPAALGAKGVEALVRPATTLSCGGHTEAALTPGCCRSRE